MCLLTQSISVPCLSYHHHRPSCPSLPAVCQPKTTNKSLFIIIFKYFIIIFTLLCTLVGQIALCVQAHGSTMKLLRTTVWQKHSIFACDTVVVQISWPLSRARTLLKLGQKGQCKIWRHSSSLKAMQIVLTSLHGTLTFLGDGLPAPLPAGFPAAFPAGFPAAFPAGFPAGLLLGCRQATTNIKCINHDRYQPSQKNSKGNNSMLIFTENLCSSWKVTKREAAFMWNAGRELCKKKEVTNHWTLKFSFLASLSFALLPLERNEKQNSSEWLLHRIQIQHTKKEKRKKGFRIRISVGIVSAVNASVIRPCRWGQHMFPYHNKDSELVLLWSNTATST